MEAANDSATKQGLWGTEGIGEGFDQARQTRKGFQGKLWPKIQKIKTWRKEARKTFTVEVILVLNAIQPAQTPDSN